MHDDEVVVGEQLVRELLQAQLPEHAGASLAIVEPWGTDHAVWRLGSELVVRLPRIRWAAGQIEREAGFLPELAAWVPFAVPEVVAIGAPGAGFPYRWAVHRWLPGASAGPDTVRDPMALVEDIARLVRALWCVPTSFAPSARGRARPLRALDDEVREAIGRADGLVDRSGALSVWEAAVEAPPHEGLPVWVHGDLEGNLLVRDGRVCGVLDWGSACTGDPAADVQVLWSWLVDDRARARLIAELAVDEATVVRSRGVAVGQACAALPYYLWTHPLMVERAVHRLAALGVGVAVRPRRRAVR